MSEMRGLLSRSGTFVVGGSRGEPRGCKIRGDRTGARINGVLFAGAGVVLTVGKTVRCGASTAVLRGAGSPTARIVTTREVKIHVRTSYDRHRNSYMYRYLERMGMQEQPRHSPVAQFVRTVRPPWRC